VSSYLRAGLDCFPDDTEHLLTFSAFERKSGGTHRLAPETALLHRQFDILHELDMGVEVQEWREPAVEGASLVPAAAHRQVPELAAFLRKRVDQSGDPTD